MVNNESLELEGAINPLSKDSSDLPLIPEFTDPLNIAKERFYKNMCQKLADESN